MDIPMVIVPCRNGTFKKEWTFAWNAGHKRFIIKIIYTGHKFDTFEVKD
jgi:hypothetical protein